MTQRIGLDRTEHAGKVQVQRDSRSHLSDRQEKVLTVLRYVLPYLNQVNRLSSLIGCARRSLPFYLTDNDVYEVLQATSERYANPRLAVGQAHDLQKPARTFQNTAKNVHVLTDFKHFLANQFS